MLVIFGVKLAKEKKVIYSLTQLYGIGVSTATKICNELGLSPNLKIKNLTEEFPTMTTFFDGEIIGTRYPFLTRKWDADEEVDRKHWVEIFTFNLRK